MKPCILIMSFNNYSLQITTYNQTSYEIKLSESEPTSSIDVKTVTCICDIDLTICSITASDAH